MAQVTIEERGCRGCTLCVDVCPGDVFNYDEQKELASVGRTVDCIGCYSCYYLCPSQCIGISDCHIQRPFYRIEDNVAFIERFVQAKMTTASLSPEDWDEAYSDVTSTMTSLSKAIVEMIGRATGAVGRKSGMMAAAHLPEMYEEKSVEGIISAMQRQFKHAFDFEPQISGEEINLTFNGCGLNRVVTKTGEEVGKATLCTLFHAYLAGLLSAYTGTNYKYEAPQTGDVCVVKLYPV